MNALLAFLRAFFAGMLDAWRAGGGDAAVPAAGSAPAPPAPAVPEAPAGVDITVVVVQAIMPHASFAHVTDYLPYLTAAMVEFAINTPLRAAAFLAQLAHESGELRYMEEIASGEAYEGRTDLGNIRPGDGVRYKGRGPIQLTGRLNYRECGYALGLPLEAQPEEASTPQVGFRVAGWYWATHHCNENADRGDDVGFRAVTMAINGGLNGLASREAYYARAREVLGA